MSGTDMRNAISANCETDSLPLRSLAFSANCRACPGTLRSPSSPQKRATAPQCRPPPPSLLSD
eukprot:666781-Rhodomonas_salina.1